MNEPAEISRKIVEVLESSLALAQVETTIERGELVNEDPDRAPWIGIYRERVRYDPRSLGNHGRSWRAAPTFVLVFQETDWSSGETCEDKLDSLIRYGLDAIVAEPTLRSAIGMLTSIDVEYIYKMEDEDRIYFQWAKVTLSADVRTGK